MNYCYGVQSRKEFLSNRQNFLNGDDLFHTILACINRVFINLHLTMITSSLILKSFVTYLILVVLKQFSGISKLETVGRVIYSSCLEPV